jgi:hypothetical protein
MKITQHVRDYAARLGGNEKAALYPDAAEQGMKEMSKKFIERSMSIRRRPVKRPTTRSNFPHPGVGRGVRFQQMCKRRRPKKGL